MKVPDAIEPAVGYRVWIVRGTRLHSVNHGSQWEPNQVFEATCASKDHEVPDENCRCGAYAAATFNRLFEMGYTRDHGLFAAPPDEITIAGQVNLWGGIVPGTIGWRAQYAYPKMLLVPYSRWQIARTISEVYNVPFKLYNLERKH